MRKIRHRNVLAIVLCLPMFVASSAAADDAPQQLTKVTVAVFKNGYAFFSRRGDVSLAKGWGTLRDIPPASHGTIWLAANGEPVDEVIVTRNSVPNSRAVASMAELLTANPGRKVTVTVRDREYTGTIVSLSQAPLAIVATGPARPEPAWAVDDSGVLVAAARSNSTPLASEPLLILDLGGKTAAFPRAEVRAVSFEGKPATAVGDSVDEKSLHFRAGTAERAAVTLSYLRDGITWAPQYLVTLENDSTARISMTALLVNDAEPLDDAEVFFVVGYPNFAFSTVRSPLGLQQSLADFLSALRGAGRSPATGAMVNVMAQSTMVSSRAQGTISTPDANEVTGTTEEDLFLYTRSHASLKQGERANYQIFSAAVSYEHLYKAEIPDTAGADWYGHSMERRDSAEDTRVWHSLRLKNSTRLPWTTAPAIAMSASRPLAQETLHYTPAGATTELKLTVAPDVDVQPQEAETSRQRIAIESNSYMAVTVKGTISVRNFKKKPVTLSIEKTLTGEVLSKSGSAKAVALASRISAVNPSTQLTWEIPLAAGATESVTYTYKVLFRV